MRQTLDGNILERHAAAAAVVGKGFIVSDDAFLNVAAGSARARLVAVALASFVAVFLAEFGRHPAEAELAAAHVERTFLSGGECVFAALGVGVAVAPTLVVGRLAIRATGVWAVIWGSQYVKYIASAWRKSDSLQYPVALGQHAPK